MLNRWPVLLVLLVAGSTLWWTWERDLIPVNEGFGWDGQMYGMYTQFLPEAFQQKAINAYRMQRVLVPAALYAILDRAGVERDVPQVIRAYRWTNIVCLVLSVALFLWISAELSWGVWSTTLGLGGMLFSVPALKMGLFYPVQPDLAAFLFGLAAVAFWVRRKWTAFILCLIIGSFTGPTMWVYALLLLTPRPDGRAVTGERLSPWWALTLPFLFFVAWVWVWKHDPSSFTDPPSRSVSVRWDWLPFAMPLTMGWLAGVGWLITLWPRVRQSLGSVRWIWWLPALIGFLAVRWTIHNLSGTEAVPQTFGSYLRLLLQQSVTWPAGFLVAHAAYIPGFVLLGGLAIRGIAPVVREWGAGAILLTGLTGIMAIGSETRQLMQVLPWVLVLLVQAADRTSRIRIPVVLGILLGLWLLTPWWQVWGHPGALDGDFLRLPAQAYFRFHGPWMNASSWRISGALLLLLLLLPWILRWTGVLIPKDPPTSGDTKS